MPLSITPFADAQTLPAARLNEVRVPIENLANREVPLSVLGVLPDTGSDLRATIQSLVDANPGKGILFDRPGDYAINTDLAGSGYRYVWTIANSHTKIRFVPGARLVVNSSLTSAIIFVLNPAANALSGTFYGMADVAIGDTAITLDLAGDAANFTVGQYVYIRARDTLGGTTAPIGEINKVRSIAGAVIGLWWPTSKPYIDDAVKTHGIKPFPAVIEDVAIDGLVVDHPHVIVGGQGVVGFEMTNWDVRCKRGSSFGHIRGGRFLHGRVRLIDDTGFPNGDNSYFLTPGVTGMTDWLVDDFRFTAEKYGYLHIHEGAAQVRVTRGVIETLATSGESVYAPVSIAGNGYDVDVDLVTIINGRKDGIKVQPGVGQRPERTRLHRITFLGTFARNLINNDGTETEIVGIRAKATIANAAYPAIDSTGPGGIIDDVDIDGAIAGAGIVVTGAGTVIGSHKLGPGVAGAKISAPNVGVSADNGDAAKTLTAGESNPVQRWATALTVNRAVTLSTTGAKNGDAFRIVRTAASTGASSLNVGVGPLKALAAGQYCDVEYDGTNWLLTAFGSL